MRRPALTNPSGQRDIHSNPAENIQRPVKLVRSATRGNVAAILRCAGVRLPQTIRQIETAEHEEILPATA